MFIFCINYKNYKRAGANFELQLYNEYTVNTMTVNRVSYFVLNALDHRVRFINGLEVGIRSVITKLHKTLSFGGKTYIKEKCTKLYQEILCKTIKFIVFFSIFL